MEDGIEIRGWKLTGLPSPLHLVTPSSCHLVRAG
jgi:hypothetical protein